jgi:hypothetical protein
VDQRTSRFWDAFWVVAPLVVGGLIGFFLAGQFPASTTDCTALPASTSTSANFALAVVLVILLVSRIVLRSVIGPVAARAMTMAAIGLVVAACGSYFVGTRTEPCPTAGIASTHEAVVWTAPSALHIS